MRAPENEPTATAGASEVSADFQRVGWGATENVRHDLGTDLFLEARDARRFDLGLLIGAQVKAGPSYFTEPKRDDDGELEGWWYRDTDGKHMEAWLAHSLPHIVVLRDMEERVSYWVHVTPDAVERTGKGAKILVPRAQIVSEEQRDALLKVAKTQRAGIPWEGSVWTAGAALTGHQLLRHALIVPRLVAPHPNAGIGGGLSPEQGIAMLMQARHGEYKRFAKEHEDVPTLSEAAGSDDWRWQFAHALNERLDTYEPDALVSTIDDAPSPETRTAATVAAAATLVERGRAEDAIDLLNVTLARDDAEPVDHAWLLMQRARAGAEIGLLEEARTDALEVVGVRDAATHDATATALAGTAANLLFETSGWGNDELEQAIRGSDTAATWWRQQTTARGLGAIVDRTFKAWASDTATTFGPDDANNQLFVASLLASHVGSQGGWRHLAGLVGCNLLLELDRHADLEHAREGLAELRLSGSTKELTLAAKKLATEGPALAVASVLSNVDLDRSSRTTAMADLALVKTCGHLADNATAARVVSQLIAILDDESNFFVRATASQGVRYQVIEALAGIVPAASTVDREAIREYLLALEGVKNQIAAINYGKVLRALPASIWDEDSAVRARQAADGHDTALSLALLGVAALHDDEASERLIALARDGSLDAVSALGSVPELPADVAKTITQRLADAADRIVSDAHNGKFGMGSVDIGSALVLLNAWHPDSAVWEPLLKLLGDDRVPTSEKHTALGSLESLADRIPPDVRDAIKPIAGRIARGEAPGVFDPFGSPGSAAGKATNLLVALNGLDPEESADRLVDLLTGDAADRRWAAYVAGRSRCPEHIGILVTLATDSDLTVRAAAVQGVASAVASGDGGRVAERALQACMADPGALVPARAAAALHAVGGDIAEQLLAPLREHPSAHVRGAALGVE